MSLTACEALKRTIALLEEDVEWVQDKWAGGTPQRPQFCLDSALCDASRTMATYGSAKLALLEVIEAESIPLWNDDLFRTKEEVLEALRVAVERLEVEPADPFPSELPDLTPVI